jgi:hypothetical protein
MLSHTRPHLASTQLTNTHPTHTNTACTDKLLQNDPSFVELSLERLGENFDLEEFVHALRHNCTVRHVCFSGTFVRELAPAQWRIMLESIAHLSTLEELQIWCSTIPTDVLAQAVRCSKHLKKVYFFRVALGGNQADMDGLGEAFRGHPSLRDVRIGGFSLTNQVRIDGVVEGLAQIQQLQVLSLQLSSSQGTIPCEAAALGALFRSTSIHDLYLSRLGLGETHIAVVAEAISSNSTLKSLDLFGNNIENKHIIRMAESLEENTSLETLVLPCPTTDLSIAACRAISQALKVNTTLVTFNLPRSNLNDAGIAHIAAGLTVNKTLKKIEVGVSKDVGDAGITALTEMLEQNYELERVVVSSTDRSIKEKAEYYMRLNEVGRGKILRDGNATREQWVEMLIAVTNDLDCLFYFLSTNPAICQFANAHQQAVIMTQEIRFSRRHTLNMCDFRPKGDNSTKSRRASAF